MKKSVLAGFLFVIFIIGLMGFVLAESNITTTCIEEGKSGSGINGDKCCDGLTATSNSVLASNGDCVGNNNGGFICAKCGNGECGLGENKCNCPKDCSDSTIKCYKDDDCGISSTSRYCSGNNACSSSTNYFCTNPGTTQSICGSAGGGGCGPCPNGCKDGVCVKGEVLDMDKCLNDPNNYWDQESNSCKSGYSKEIIPKLCTDPDGGKNIYQYAHTFGFRSYSSASDPSRDLRIRTGGADGCISDIQIVENYCDENGYIQIAYIDCPNGCKDGACIQETKCTTDSDCPQLCPTCGIGVSCGGCINYKCLNGKCISQKSCQPTKCDDGTFTECKGSNGVCSCSSCPPIIIKPVCGNGVCESGEGEICATPQVAISCEKGKECKIPPPNCFVVCPQDCKPREVIYANLNEKFKLEVYQSAKIQENNNDVLKITFKDLIAYKCKEAELSVSESQVINEKVASVTGGVIFGTTTTSASETTTSSTSSSGGGGGSGGGSGPTTTSSGGGGGGAGISVLKCIGAGPKALLGVETIVNGELGKNNIINLDVGEKKQVEDFTIYFSGYDYASRTGIFLVSRETFNCPAGCKCDNNEEIVICSNKTCGEKETLCPDGTCKDKCNIINPDECKYGCMYEGKCFPMGVRTSGLYCSDNLVMSSQKKSDEKCENNFECSSNVCISGKCIDEGFINKLMNWFKKLFGG